jgi:hypothetical protein
MNRWCCKENDISTKIVPTSFTMVTSTARYTRFNSDTITWAMIIYWEVLDVYVLPSWRFFTFGPTLITLPELSWPTTIGARTTKSPMQPRFYQEVIIEFIKNRKKLFRSTQ